MWSPCVTFQAWQVSPPSSAFANTVSGKCKTIVLTPAYPAGSGPRWLYYLNGFSVFWYLHLDCLDGKQARRTKSSSPLGQLFDHGMLADTVCLDYVLVSACTALSSAVHALQKHQLDLSLPFKFMSAYFCKNRQSWISWLMLTVRFLTSGCDALSVHLILTVIAATLSIGISWKAVVGSLGVMIPWQLAHWEEYHTG